MKIVKSKNLQEQEFGIVYSDLRNSASSFHTATVASLQQVKRYIRRGEQWTG